MIQNIPHDKNEIMLLGKSKQYQLNSEQIKIFHENFIDIVDISFFDRLIILNEKYSVDSYSERFKSNDSIIIMQNNNFAILKYLFEFKKEKFFMAEILNIDYEDKFHKICNQMNAVNNIMEPTFVIHSVSEIKEKCIIANFQNVQYIIKFPNPYEND